jgi:cytochrome c peroxidase
MRTKIILFIALIGFICGFASEKDNGFTVPTNWPKPFYNFSRNPLTQEKSELGRKLFYDPILSVNNTISCASCHSPYNAFAHTDHALSHGIYDHIGTRNAPALQNLAWQPYLMWDGAIANLDMQSLAPMTHPDEMGENIQHVVEKLNAEPDYRSMFKVAFGDSIVTGEHTLKAIAQFMLTLVSSNAKYDSVMRGTSQFTAQEQNGYGLFKQNCASCHAEPLFTNFAFENNGLPVDTTLNDKGRQRISRNTDDSLKFKVPSLRNVEFTSPYMHDGRFKRLSEVLIHYTIGIQQTPTLSEKLQKPIVLNSNEKVDLIAFLLTLSDRHFIFDPSHAYPKDLNQTSLLRGLK